jgi:hypothetical protein
MAEIKQENASLKGTSRGLATMLEMSERRKRLVTHSKVALLMCCVGEFEQHIPLFLVRICKNQQAIACWKCCTTQKC